MQALWYTMVNKTSTDPPFTRLCLEETRTSNQAVIILLQEKKYRMLWGQIGGKPPPGGGAAGNTSGRKCYWKLKLERL